jgi:hypothetical protein
MKTRRSSQAVGDQKPEAENAKKASQKASQRAALAPLSAEFPRE